MWLFAKIVFTLILFVKESKVTTAFPQAIQIGYVPTRPTYHPNPGNYVSQIIPPGDPWPSRPEDYDKFSQTTKQPTQQTAVVVNRLKEPVTESSSTIDSAENSSKITTTETLSTTTLNIAMNITKKEIEIEERISQEFSSTTTSSATIEIEPETDEVFLNITNYLDYIASLQASVIDTNDTKDTTEVTESDSELYTSKLLETTSFDENTTIISKLQNEVEVVPEVVSVSNLLPVDQNANKTNSSLQARNNFEFNKTATATINDSNTSIKPKEKKDDVGSQVQLYIGVEQIQENEENTDDTNLPPLDQNANNNTSFSLDTKENVFNQSATFTVGDSNTAFKPIEKEQVSSEMDKMQENVSNLPPLDQNANNTSSAVDDSNTGFKPLEEDDDDDVSPQEQLSAELEKMQENVSNLPPLDQNANNTSSTVDDSNTGFQPLEEDDDVTPQEQLSAELETMQENVSNLPPLDQNANNTSSTVDDSNTTFKPIEKDDDVPPKEEVSAELEKMQENVSNLPPLDQNANNTSSAVDDSNTTFKPIEKDDDVPPKEQLSAELKKTQENVSNLPPLDQNANNTSSTVDDSNTAFKPIEKDDDVPPKEQVSAELEKMQENEKKANVSNLPSLDRNANIYPSLSLHTSHNFAFKQPATPTVYNSYPYIKSKEKHEYVGSQEQSSGELGKMRDKPNFSNSPPFYQNAYNNPSSSLHTSNNFGFKLPAAPAVYNSNPYIKPKENDDCVGSQEQSPGELGKIQEKPKVSNLPPFYQNAYNNPSSSLHTSNNFGFKRPAAPAVYNSNPYIKPKEKDDYVGSQENSPGELGKTQEKPNVSNFPPFYQNAYNNPSSSLHTSNNFGFKQPAAPAVYNSNPYTKPKEKHDYVGSQEQSSAELGNTQENEDANCSTFNGPGDSSFEISKAVEIDNPFVGDSRFKPFFDNGFFSHPQDQRVPYLVPPFYNYPYYPMPRPLPHHAPHPIPHHIPHPIPHHDHVPHHIPRPFYY